MALAEGKANRCSRYEVTVGKADTREHDIITGSMTTCIQSPSSHAEDSVGGNYRLRAIPSTGEWTPASDIVSSQFSRCACRDATTRMPISLRRHVQIPLPVLQLGRRASFLLLQSVRCTARLLTILALALFSGSVNGLKLLIKSSWNTGHHLTMAAMSLVCTTTRILTVLAHNNMRCCQFSFYRPLLAFFMVQSCSCTFITAIPDPPRNLTVQWLAPHAVTLSWTLPDSVQVARIEMVIRPVVFEVTQYMQRTMAYIDRDLRSHTFRNLYPETQYQVFGRVISMDGTVSNYSEVVTFRTVDDIEVRSLGLRVKPGEVLIVILILLAWVCAIVLFLHKWGKIRLSTPSEPRYKHAPKNIDTIKVCARPTDSVIYRNYPKEITRNMEARTKKRIERMNTMPNIKINEIGKPLSKPVRAFKKMPVIEMEETIAETSLS